MRIANYFSRRSNNVRPAFHFKKSAGSFFHKYRFVAAVGAVFGIILYSLMMSQQLTNTFDALWEQNFHAAGRVELSSGRWLLHYVDKLVMGLHADPIASIAALLLYIVGFLLVLDLFEVEDKFCGAVCLILFISSTAISNTLSYRFTSLGYGLAYLFGILSLYSLVKIKNTWLSIGAAGVLLGLSASCYQAYLAVFCITAMFYIIFLCGKFGKAEVKGKRLVLQMFCTLVLGAAVYAVSLSYFLELNNVTLSGYNGIGEFSVKSLIVGFPQNIVKAYRAFGAYFFLDGLKINRLQAFGVHYLPLALFAALLIVVGIKVWKTKKPLVVVLLLAAAAIPVAGNAYMIIAGDKLELQMAVGLAMFIPLTMMLAFTVFGKKRFVRSFCAILSIVLIYGSSMQVWFDQEAMYEGQNACETMATQVIADLNEQNLLSTEYQYFFVGVPADNPFFYVSDIYDCANAYAQMGNFWIGGSCCNVSYNGLISKRMGFNLPINYLRYAPVAEREDVSAMPIFPQEGYIRILDGNTVVIKISEHKPYTGFSKYVFD